MKRKVVLSFFVAFVIVFLVIRPNSPPLIDKPQSSTVVSGEVTNIGLMQEGFVDVFIGFKVRNRENLENFVNNAQMQARGQQEALTEEQFEADYAPARADYDKAISFIEAHNMSVKQTWANRLLLAARGSVNDVENAFNIEIGLFEYENTCFYKSLEEVNVPPFLKMLGVEGIEINSFPAEPCLARFSGTTPNTIASNMSPDDLRKAYGTYYAIQGGWTGTGETIGIVDAYGDSTIENDVNSFNSYYNLPSLTLNIGGTGGTAPQGSNWPLETALDVEWAHAMAPDATIRLQLSQDASAGNMFGAVNTLVSLQSPPSIISLSFALNESQELRSAYSSIFAAANSRGIKVYAATGDWGAYNSDAGTNLQVSYPASDPNVIAVGGTSLYCNTVQGTDEFYEYGWSDSGGGYSTIFSEPTYQSNAGIPDSTGMRALPDVSLEAYPGVNVYLGGLLYTGVGGTSLSTPLLAGISAVALNGNWNLDNNAFYNLYTQTSKYEVAFHDVYISGNNGYYTVAGGWDAVTGLGSVNFHNFANIFYQSDAVTLIGESLSPSSITAGQSFSMSYTISNPNPSYSLIQIGLGASIRLHGSTTEITDPANDVYVSIPGGTSTQSRMFITTSSLTPGWYDVAWAVWMGPPGMGNVLSSSGWQSSQLQLSAPTQFYSVRIVMESLDDAAGCRVKIDGVNYRNNDVVSLSAGAHTCEAVTPSGWGWLSWFTTTNCHVANPSSSSTALIVSGNGAFGADWGPVVTFYTSPSSGGTVTVYYYGAATPFTEIYSNGQSGTIKGYSSNLIANSASGYTFSSWSSIGSMGISSPTSSTTQWNPTGPGTVTANFASVPFDFSISASPSSRTVTAGGSTIYQVDVTLLGGATQSVSLSCSSSITGVTYQFAPQSSNPTFSSALTVQTSVNTPANTYTLTITGTGGGQTHFTTMQLIVSTHALVGYWKFDEGSGTVAADSSGNGNTGTLMNGPQWVDGVKGKALQFDGVNDYVSVPDSSSVDIGGNQMSVEYWMKLPMDWHLGMTRDMDIYAKGNSYVGSMIGQSGAHRFNFAYFPTPYPETNKITWKANTWYHIADVYDGSCIRMYVNGVLDKSEAATGQIPNTSLELEIAGAFSWPWYFNGTIDDFAIYNYARTAEEIQNDYKAPLVGYWKFDEGSGTTASDSSGNGNTGTLMNGPQWVEGISGTALNFDGLDDYVSISDSPSLDVSGNKITIQFWMKPTVDLPYASYGQQIFDKGDAYTGAIFDASHPTDGGKYAVNLPFFGHITSTTSFWVSGTWYHLAVTYDGSNMRLYVNGVLENIEPTTGNVQSTSYPLSIGSYTLGTVRFFKGIIDEFAIYDYARSPEEVWNDWISARADLVVRGGDNRVWFRTYSGGVWGSWHSIAAATGDSLGAAMLGNDLHIIARNLAGTTIWHGYVNVATNTFSGWTLISGHPVSAPTLTSNGAVLCLVVRGGDNKVWYRTYSGGVWGSWHPIAAATGDSLGATMLGNNLHIVARDLSGTTIWHGYVDVTTNAFSGWTLISGHPVSAPTLASNGTVLSLVVRGGDNKVWYRTYSGGVWGSWHPIAAATGDSLGATMIGNKLHIVARNLAGTTIWHGYVNLDTNAFSGWTLISGKPVSKPTLTS